MKRQRNTAGKATRSATITKLEGDHDVKVVSVHAAAGIETMKRTIMTTKNKKNKRDHKEEKEEDHVVARRNGGDLAVPTTMTAAETIKGWEEWPWMNGVVDEQMCWGSFWLPNWDVEFVGKAYNVLYGDVVWDDDIWDLKGITQVPNS